MSAHPPAIKVGISSCLLGQPVRYDGGHKLSMLCTVELARYFDLIPACPEAGAGLGIPRPPIRLTGDPAAPRAVQVMEPHVDVTTSLLSWLARQIPQMQDLCGYIFIRNSPSCGLFQVNVFQDDDDAVPGRGIFAAAVTRAMPLLPVEEDGRLRDPVLRENFVTRVHIWHNWRLLQAAGLNMPALREFHTRCKYTVMASSPGQYRKLSHLLAHARDISLDELGERYIGALMTILQRRATRRSNAHVLGHLQRCLKPHLSVAEGQRLSVSIDRYRHGTVPLAQPASLLQRHLQHVPVSGHETFLQPFAAAWPGCDTDKHHPVIAHASSAGPVTSR